jgi:glycosyltransferase involved in cell wall biosynthesis
MARVLLTVSGTIDPALASKVARGERPRADYAELARALGADLLDYAGAARDTGAIGRLIARLAGPNALLAWGCWCRRDQYELIFTDGEQVGIPLALLLKRLGRGTNRVRHAMLVHTLSVRKKLLFFDYARVQSHIDRFVVYASWQKQFIEARLGVPGERVMLTPFMVDANFFSLAATPPVPPSAHDTPTICAVGLERRDYSTLMQAVRELPVHVVIAAASPWSKQSDTTNRAEIPDNVSVRRFSQFDLRTLYAQSAFLVMPLYDVTFQAGITAILEAMAMERAVICSRTAGQSDTVVEDESGVYVPPGDVAALRAAIERLLARPHDAARMGRVGRAMVEAELSLDRYVSRLAAIVADTVRN